VPFPVHRDQGVLDRIIDDRWWESPGKIPSQPGGHLKKKAMIGSGIATLSGGH
jgi:hypothetical protein